MGERRRGPRGAVEVPPAQVHTSGRASKPWRPGPQSRGTRSDPRPPPTSEALQVPSAFRPSHLHLGHVDWSG